MLPSSLQALMGILSNARTAKEVWLPLDLCDSSVPTSGHMTQNVCYSFGFTLFSFH
jgi:hypothetical protein